MGRKKSKASEGDGATTGLSGYVLTASTLAMIVACAWLFKPRADTLILQRNVFNDSVASRFPESAYSWKPLWCNPKAAVKSPEPSWLDEFKIEVSHETTSRSIVDSTLCDESPYAYRKRVGIGVATAHSVSWFRLQLFGSTIS